MSHPSSQSPAPGREHAPIHALIPAAGLSVRFGGTTLKQYAHLLGKPVIAHSIESISGHPLVRDVTVALAEDDGIYNELVRPAFPMVGTTVGGSSRAQTVLNGVRHILREDPAAEWVLVHDAARPCLPARILDALIATGLGSPSGAIVAIPVSDTIKRSANGETIDETVDRKGLWRAQTPQLFPVRKLAAALEAAMSEAASGGPIPTDEASVMERAGARPRLVMGAQINIKITGAEDLELAGILLKAFGLERQKSETDHADANRSGV